MEILVAKHSAPRRTGTFVTGAVTGPAEAYRLPDALRFLAVVIVTLLLFALFWGAAAYIVNPYGKFAPRIFPVLTLSDRNEKMNRFKVFAENGRVDGLILGSSRTMMLDPASLAGSNDERIFNFGVTAAVPEDWLAIYRWVRVRGAHPKNIYVGVDVETLDKRVPWTGDLKDTPKLVRMISTGRAESKWELWRESARDMKDTFRTSFAFDAGRSAYLFVRPKLALYHFDSNGLIHYDAIDQKRSRGQHDPGDSIQTCVKTYDARLGDASEVSPQRLIFLMTLIQEARSDGARVVLWVTQFQPDAARQLMLTHPDYTRMSQSTNSHLQEMQRRFGVTLVNISSIGKTAEFSGDWYDCVHYDHRLAAQIADLLRSSR